MELEGKIRALISSIEILNPEEIDLIVEKTIVDSFSKGTFLLREGQVATKCYMVVEGCVREYLILDGEEKSTAFYTEGEKFAAYINEGKGVPSKHYWECLEDCVLTISTHDFEEELRSLLPRLDAIIQQIAMAKLSKAKEDWSQFISSSPEERYLNLMKQRPALFDRVAQHQIASYLGMKPQSLSRIRKRTLEKNNEAPKA